jgi:peroxiredoxin (alkyl hydroperoxide reductase subunit C)
MKQALLTFLALLLVFSAAPGRGQTHSNAFTHKTYDPGELKPTDSELKVAVGDKAPDFKLPAVSGEKVALSRYRGKKNVVLSFVPAAWTPVCSDQWPGYNIIEPVFQKHDAVLLGITVDNIPSLHAWTREMGRLWFPVLSDFWPHGAAAKKFGILRSDGTSERALFIIDKKGVIRHIAVTNINKRPPLENLTKALERLD